MDNQSEASNYRILLVDDNPSIHEDFRKILCPRAHQSGATLDTMVEELFGDAPKRRNEGCFEVDSAFQGQEALEKVQAADSEGRPYSLAFMDVRMPPGWDGIETVKHIWLAHPHIQVVICTAYSDYSWEQILQGLGETDSLVILKKPFDNVEVLQLAYTLTKKWSVTRKANARMADLDQCVERRTQELLETNQLLKCEVQRRSLMEAALRESEERFRKAFETISVALGIRPLASSHFIDINQRLLALSGYTKEELLGKTPEELGLWPAPERYAQLIQSARTGGQVREAQLQVRTKTGELLETLLSIEVLHLGEQSCILLVLQDVTAQRKLELQLRQSQKMDAIGQLAAGVAHDFNNLLTIIHGYSSLQLAKRSLDADVTKAFTQVKLASERAAALTRQLLTFSRQQIVQRKPLELGAAISRLKSLLGRTLGETIQLECNLAAALPCVSADESNLDQVIMNLAINARDAMPKGGKLILSTKLLTRPAEPAEELSERRAGSFVVFIVTDTGCGMDRQTLGRIFEPFFTTKPIGHGTGLGLSTVYGIVKQHEGWVEVESQPGQGTTFRVFLPVSHQRPEPKPEPVPTRGEPPSALQPGEAIFVVEDETDVRQFIASALSGEGYAVIQAASGAEALALWNQVCHKVRLVLTDMVMPGGISGTTLSKHLLRHSPNLRIIYTSGYCPDSTNGPALQEGVNFLAKPFGRDCLLTAVRNGLLSPMASLEPPRELASASAQCQTPQSSTGFDLVQ